MNIEINQDNEFGKNLINNTEEKPKDKEVKGTLKEADKLE